MLIKVVVLVVLAEVVLGQKPVLHLCDKPQTGMKCMIMCDLADDTAKPVKIYRGATEVAECKNATTCMGKIPAYTNSIISWHRHGNMTMMHFTIKSLNITVDEGKWKCSHGAEMSDEQDLKIYSKPSSCHLMKVGEKENATLECHVSCVYPQTEVSVKLFVDNKVTTEMSTKSQADSSNCAYTEEKSLEYTWPLTFNPESVYRCECSVSAIGWTSSGTLQKDEGKDGVKVTTIVAIVIVVVFVVIAIVIAIVLIKKKRNAKGGARLAKEEEGEREEL